MTMGTIIEAIWNMPWYKVLIIAAVDDAILFLKIWPLYVVILIIMIIVFIKNYDAG